MEKSTMMDDDSPIKSSEEIYEVEKIVGIRFPPKKSEQPVLFRVRWKGWDEKDDTWEPYEHFESSRGLANEYLKRHMCKKKKAKEYRETVSFFRSCEQDDVKSKLPNRTPPMPCSSDAPASSKTKSSKEACDNIPTNAKKRKMISERQKPIIMKKKVVESFSIEHDNTPVSKKAERSTNLEASTSDDTAKKASESVPLLKGSLTVPNVLPSSCLTPLPKVPKLTSSSSKPKFPSKVLLPLHKNAEQRPDRELKLSRSIPSRQITTTSHDLSLPPKVTPPDKHVVQMIDPRLTSKHSLNILESPLMMLQETSSQPKGSAAVPNVDSMAKSSALPSPSICPAKVLPYVDVEQRNEPAPKVSPIAPIVAPIAPIVATIAPIVAQIAPKSQQRVQATTSQNNGTRELKCSSVTHFSSKESPIPLAVCLPPSDPMLEPDLLLKSAVSCVSQHLNFDPAPKDVFVVNRERINNDLKHCVHSNNRIGLATLHKRFPNCDLEQPNERGSTLLMHAAWNNYFEIVEYLAVQGVDVNARHKISGATPLIQACRQGATASARILLTLGSRINDRDKDGCTSLMLACKFNHLDIMNLLLMNGANYAVTDMYNKNARDYALSHRSSITENLILCLKSHIHEVRGEFEKQICFTMQNTVKIKKYLFPIHCLALKEGTSFSTEFTYDHKDAIPDSVSVLCIANAFFVDGDMTCYLYGTCPVTSATLNGYPLKPLTTEGRFLQLLTPLEQGTNILRIATINAPADEVKILLGAAVMQNICALGSVHSE